MSHRNLTDEDLANALEADGEIPIGILVEAARRIRHADLQHLLTMNEVVSTIDADPNIQGAASRALEVKVAAIPLTKKSYTAIRGLARRIINGSAYSDHEVRQLAACCLASDD